MEIKVDLSKARAIEVPPVPVAIAAPIGATSSKSKPWFNVPWYLFGNDPWCGVLSGEELVALEAAVIAKLDPAQAVYTQVNGKNKFTEYGHAAKKEFHDSVLAAIERKKEQVNANTGTN